MIKDCPSPQHNYGGADVERYVNQCDTCARVVVWQRIVDESGWGHFLPERHKPMCECGATSDLWLFIIPDKVGQRKHLLDFVACDTCARGKTYMGAGEVVSLDDSNILPVDRGWLAAD